LSSQDIKSKFSEVKDLDQLIETIRTDLVSFVEQHTKRQGTNLEKTSVLSCTKKISKEKGQDVRSFFCSIINFSVKVQKFMIPMLKYHQEIYKFCLDFIDAVNEDLTPIKEKKGFAELYLNYDLTLTIQKKEKHKIVVDGKEHTANGRV